MLCVSIIGIIVDLSENRSGDNILKWLCSETSSVRACVGDVSGHICPRGGLTLYSLPSSFAVVTLPPGDLSLLTLLPPPSYDGDSGVGRESRPSTE